MYMLHEYKNEKEKNAKDLNKDFLAELYRKKEKIRNVYFHVLILMKYISLFDCVLKVESIKGNMHSLNRCDVGVVLTKTNKCGRRNPFDEKFSCSKLLAENFWAQLTPPLSHFYFITK